MSGNAMTNTLNTGINVPDPQALCEYLTKKRDDLNTAIDKIKQSQLFEVLTTYNDPQKFIDELSLQLSTRIKQLERRTRTRK